MRGGWKEQLGVEKLPNQINLEGTIAKFNNSAYPEEYCSTIIKCIAILVGTSKEYSGTDTGWDAHNTLNEMYHQVVHKTLDILGPVSQENEKYLQKFRELSESLSGDASLAMERVEDIYKKMR